MNQYHSTLKSFLRSTILEASDRASTARAKQVVITCMFLCCICYISTTKAQKAILLENISWTTARDILKESSTIVIPLGAGSKEHGPHLPLATDFIQAEGLKHLIAKQCEVIITPTISYGYYPAFIKYAGSTTTYFHTSRDMILEIVRTLAAYGPRRFYIINVGVSTTPTLASAASILRKDGILLYYSDYRRANFTKVDETYRKTAYGGHADDGETSNILYLRPDLVDMTKASNDSSAKNKSGPMTPYELAGGTYNPSGINGYSRLATKKTGKQYLQAFANTIVEEISEIKNAILPLPKESKDQYSEYIGQYRDNDGKKMIIGLHENRLYYEWNGLERRNFFPLHPVTTDYFSALPFNLLFVRNDLGQVHRAWCQMTGDTFWVYKVTE